MPDDESGSLVGISTLNLVMVNKILIAENLTREYGSGRALVRAVDNVSMTVLRGQLVLIMGPSGSGKTTLLSMLGGLLRPTEGKIMISDTEITKLDESVLPSIRARKVGFIFQGFNLLDALTVEENILFPTQLVAGGINAKRARANELIERLDLSSRRKSLPRTLSGGEKQRVAIARALINSPPLILADEPTGNLDSHNGQEVMMILQNIVNDEECTVIMVTHDPRVEDISDRILWLEDGALRNRKTELHSWVKDPVCGMRVDEWTAEVFMEYRGKRYVFCSYRCQEKFKIGPTKYITS
jgi:putative ABC transport system ATP-binding protein